MNDYEESDGDDGEWELLTDEEFIKLVGKIKTNKWFFCCF
jgi:hypothetical protein